MYYAVAKGKIPGIYNTWTECSEQVKRFKGAKFKKFTTKEEAQNFITPKIDNDFKVDYYVYTDGACSNNGRKNAEAGIGIYFGKDDPRNISERISGKQTNNTAELKAIIKTLNMIQKDVDIGKKICIASDSEYSIKCATTYGEKMEKNNWKKDIPNKKLVKEIYTLYKNISNVRFKHIMAHTGKKDIHSIGNDGADKLANKAIGLEECPYSSILDFM